MCKYATCIQAPTTTSFDNRAVGKGVSKKYTGAIMTHQDTGVSLGIVTDEARMTAKHWDNVMIGWNARLNKWLAVQLQASADKKGLTFAGATIKWQPTTDTTVMAEAFRQNDEKTAVLAANHCLTDNVTLFTGTQITSPRDKKAEGLANAGVNYKIGKYLQFVGAVQQEIGKNRKTAALLGLKFSRDF